MTIKDAVEALEKARDSTVISYIATDGFIDMSDCLALDDNLSSLTDSGQKKLPKLDLILHSSGGMLEAAYKFVRICRQYCDSFAVIVPVFAKSAASFICFAADEIVMTTVSELGPVDPIIQHPQNPNIRVPARSIADYLEFIAGVETKVASINPETRRTLDRQLDPYLIGSYQSAITGSKEIIKRLLEENTAFVYKEKIPEVVKLFTETYRLHTFPIDRDELDRIGFGPMVVRPEQTPGLLVAIKQLLGIYLNFMQVNDFIKLQGNRYKNWHVGRKKAQV